MRWAGITLGLAGVIGLSACAPPADRSSPAPVVFEGSSLEGPAPTETPRPPVEIGAEDERGIITYETFQVVRVREADSFQSIAERIGSEPAAIAGHNALDLSMPLTAGDLLVLPPREDRYGVALKDSDTQPAWSPTLAQAAIARAGIEGTASARVPIERPETPLPQTTRTEIPVSSGRTPVSVEQPRTESATVSIQNDPSIPRNGITPVVHVVEPGESVFSISRLYGVSVTAISSWNGLSGNLGLAPGALVYIPITIAEDGTVEPEPLLATPSPAAAPIANPVLDQSERVAVAIETVPVTDLSRLPVTRETAADPVPVPAPPVARGAPEDDLIISSDGTASATSGEAEAVPVPDVSERVVVVLPQPEGQIPLPTPASPGTRGEADITPTPSATTLAPPPSADDPLPEAGAGEVTPPPPMRLSETNDSDALLLRPVEGPVLRPFSNALGSDRNDGIDFSTVSGGPVRAADAGQVVYVAQSVGDFGRIVMVRHPNDLVTAYARLGDVLVSRGDTVSRGQTIGTAAPSNTPSVQFQVLQNMSPVDPAPFF